ncbi:MAG: ABC transporter ATP-binding protein [Ilumatobacter sp.]|uniref:ABC transporter ATP-binding protein n=1 Tax=Ilumatobacter sp. TaxID=1967498 RepID=UPI00391AE878
MPVTDALDTEQSTGSISTRPISILAEGVDIRYKVYEDRSFSARKLVSGGFAGRRAIEVHAVKSASFTVHVGEAVGVVGTNGSGKSTLLRAVAGLQSLASGSIKVRGEVGLLGVGAALKPSLSGYRNVYLGGLAVGLSKDEIDAKLPEIVEFSGLGEAMARPMATYSSGMKARLAFSISTLKVPDILLIDEALAVGDKDFREKSLARLNEIREQAGTIMMVTHNLNEIRQSCTRAIWLDQGELLADGAVDEVVERYEAAR